MATSNLRIYKNYTFWYLHFSYSYTLILPSTHDKVRLPCMGDIKKNHWINLQINNRSRSSRSLLYIFTIQEFPARRLFLLTLQWSTTSRFPIVVVRIIYLSDKNLVWDIWRPNNSSPKVRQQHDDCSYIIKERKGSDKTF